MIKVIKPGFSTSIQDLGRFGYRKFGVPQSGVMDENSALMANALLNNNKNDAVLEITIAGPVLEFLSDTYIAICGGEVLIVLNTKVLKTNKIYKITEGSVLTIGTITKGIRCYLAVQGGFQIDKIMGSRSQFNDITKNKIILKNDLLHINNVVFQSNIVGVLKKRSYFFETETLEIYEGPDFELFTKEQQSKLVQTTYTISREMNRMGVRLNDSVFRHNLSILTSPVLPGSIQFTPEGNLIILMKDAQTTGGYPRVFQLTEKSISILAQKKPNDRIAFKLMKLV